LGFLEEGGEPGGFFEDRGVRGEGAVAVEEGFVAFVAGLGCGFEGGVEEFFEAGVWWLWLAGFYGG
jgi:hypothetical protein